MIRALRFSPGDQPQHVPAADLPAEPGGGFWCDLARDDVPPADPAPGAAGRRETEGCGDTPAGGGDADAVARWLQRLHPLTATLLRDPSSHGPAVTQERYVHVRLRCPPHTKEAGAAAPEVIDVVLGQGFALTVHGRHAPWEDVWEGYAQGRRQADGADFALYQGLARVNQAYRETTAAMLGATERLVERLTEKRAHAVLADIVRLRRTSTERRTALAGAVEAWGLLSASAHARPQVRPFYRDLRDDAKRLLQTVEDARSTMAEGIQGYTSVQSNEMNRVMQIFTVIAVVFMPATLIASIYGMNFKIPEYHWGWGYIWAVGLMVVTSATLMAWFKARHYL